MWVLYGILPPLLLIGVIVAAVVAFVRGRAAITFSGVLMGYVALAMLISVFLLASGGALLIKTGLSEAVGRDFSYNTELEPRYSPREPPYYPEPDVAPVYPRPEPETWVDPSDNDLRNDIAAGVTLVFVGLTLFAVHAVAAVVLRRRGAQGADFVSRVYNLLGLAGASIGFLASGGNAVYGIIRRYALETENLEPWDFPHPGEPLAFAAVFLPLSLWFGWRVWQEFAGEAPE